MTQHILLFSVNGDLTEPLRQRLSDVDIILVEVRTSDKLYKELLTKKYDVLLHRCLTASFEQLSVLRFIKQHRLTTRVIVLSKVNSAELAMRAVKAGANDVIVAKELDKELAEKVVQNVVHDSIGVGKAATQTTNAETILVGQSPAIEEVRTAVNLVAQSQTPVLITGESGTGKEVVARLVHLQSDRANKPFIALNCAALPKDVIENELFGHERGAFTGALDKKAGCFELAHHGTLFFDEIAEMSPETQAKLLRAIETKAFRRLGGKEEIRVDVRTIAATNKRMDEALKSGEFREDLYYRFSVIEIYIPPLRDRREDIPPLVDHFLAILCRQYKKPRQRFSNESMEILRMYDWPGNVRELRNIIERSVVTCHEKIITPRWLPDRISMLQHTNSTISLPIGISARDAERRFILETLAAVGNNKSRAAQLLGMSRKTLHNKLQRFSD